jgi:DNA-binding Lrp family transcriptional regulator
VAGELDALDVALIREMSHPRASFQWNIRESYAEMGRILGVDEEMVRLRLKRLQEAGVLARLELVPHPHLLGRGMVRIDLEVEDRARREAFLEQVRLLDGVRWIFEFYGGTVGVVLFHEPGAPFERQLALLASLSGATPRPWEMTLPPCALELTRTDWRIVRALRCDPRRPFTEVAEEVGVSTKTLQRRVDRLTAARACFTSSVIDFARARGVIPVEVAVPHRDEACRDGIDAFLRATPHLVFSRFERAISGISFAAWNLADVDAYRRELADVAGAEGAAVRVLLHRTSVDAWLDERIEHEATREAPARTDATPPWRARANAK